ncbi:hypothetical protein HYX58_02525 [Candidatus Dependentiae bacterium]|nr:hypothetical protein [Candidatus Dependentiae bacterium]
MRKRIILLTILTAIKMSYANPQLIKMASQETLKERLTQAKFDDFACVTKIHEKLGDQEVCAAGLYLTVQIALQDEYVKHRKENPELVKSMLESTTQIIQTLVPDSPEFLEELSSPLLIQSSK